MVGIAAAATILGKVTEPAIDPVKRQLGYVFCFNANVETFKDKVVRLGDIGMRVRIQVDAALSNLEIIDPIVERWLLDAGLNAEESKTIIEDIGNFPEGCFSRWCLNLKLRYILSRKAKRKTKDIIKLCQEGNFERVSFPPQSIQIIVSTSIVTFKTRERVLKEIIQNLKDENISMIGICGMGGIGKATMTEMVCETVKEQKIFDEVAITVISQKRDIAKIQRDIAEMLKLQLNEQNLKVREGKLYQRLGSSRVLVILDDVWEEFDLKELGITLQGSQKRLKVLFTTREQGLWRQLKEKIDYTLDILTEKEACELFKAKVNDTLEDESKLQSVAKEIVKECGRLPLALVTIGGALGGRNIHSWKDTLRELKTDYQTKIRGVSAKVYQSLELSYKFMKEDAKSLFLLCSMFEEDSTIPVNDLIRMVMGLRLFKGIVGSEETRDRVFTLLEDLKDRNLLLPVWHDLYYNLPLHFRMHDIVLDVARSISMAENGALVVNTHARVTTLHENDIIKDSEWISIVSEDINELPAELKFSRVKLLRCSNIVLQNICYFLDEMTEIRVLDVDGRGSPVFPFSHRLPISLRTLFLRNAEFKEHLDIADLPNLESLSFAWSRMKELPINIGRMTNLVSLDLTGCYEVKTIQPGVISGLRQLQELYMGKISIDWEGGESNEGRNASLREFESLSNLHTLHIKIMDAGAIPRSPIFKNLKKYDIEIGTVTDLYNSWNFSRLCDKCFSIQLSAPVILVGGIKFLLENAERLNIIGDFTKDLLHGLVEHGSRSLEALRISEIDSLEYLTIGCFENPKDLVVEKCHKLRNLCQPPYGNEIVHLKKITVRDCESMEEVIWKERKEDETNKLACPNLTHLDFQNLPNLVSFCSGIDQVKFPQLYSISLERLPKIECVFSDLCSQPLFPQKVLLPRLEHISLRDMENMKDIWCGQLQNGFFCNLTRLRIEVCHKLRAVFTTYVARYLVHPKYLYVVDCSLLEVVIAKEEEEEEDRVEDTTILPVL